MSGYERDGRNKLIERHLPLAWSLARRYNRGREPLEDLFQVASEALVKAADRYDVTRGLAFSSYAVPCITGALKRYFRDHTWAVHVPRPVKDRAVSLKGALARLEVELGRDPSDAELAAVLGAEIDAVSEARAVIDAQAALSLDARRSYDDDDDDDAFLLGVAAPPEPPGDDIWSIIKSLPERERTIVSLRFRDELTQREIGRRVGMSQMHVCRLLARSLAQLEALPEVRELAAA
jgi:RNA polymerase sigma-B factor